ncbi:hypothetical protein CRU94_04625 [Arcobacter sp. AHV-9/2010]|uniref:hypothetical protein n=1 Tax=Arcobacter sp. AHV-9/2010 TaxID=2021861 RepID=UPI00100B9A15|nr:hypothetical protein [Arcobacter sp. CECT 9299]RXJ95901.1 hypothetical protein CRU94_04625 [Arcobacter sp. CECT 9299]
MKIIGDRLVPFEEFFIISSIEDIKNTASNSLLFFDFDEELLKYCQKQNLNFFVSIKTIKEGIYANSFNAKYAVCTQDLAKKMQIIADNYMFDTKILALIDTSDELEDIASEEIDGAIYSEVLKDKS